MDTSKLKNFAQEARRSLIEQVRIKLDAVLSENSLARREKGDAVKDIENEIKEIQKNLSKNSQTEVIYSDKKKEQLIEKVAYTWFNRFCALRFMDLNNFNHVKVVSPIEENLTQPEILDLAKCGNVDSIFVKDETKRKIITDILNGKFNRNDPLNEVYGNLIVAVCNYYHKIMPNLFEEIDDYTELLMPIDLLSDNSILAKTRAALTKENCNDVEIIGWLYQYYISEKKDQVFVSFKNGKKAEAEHIPAATQLFTPHWIVRYLVENSLGRLWLLNHPRSKLIEKMEYYVKPKDIEDDFLQIKTPEELKICDPACGSGHMLTYAFDLLYSIYEEEGYTSTDIPKKILTHNLFGFEIDERASELANFALTMKARSKDRNFFNNPIQPNICVIEKIDFEEHELKNYLDFVDKNRKIFNENLLDTLHQFKEADNFGALIKPKATDVSSVLSKLQALDLSANLIYKSKA